MRQLTRTLLTLFAAVLALWLVVGFWPLSTVSRSVLSICILLVCGAALWHRWRRRQFVIPVTEHVLPPDDFQGAVVLACGDTASLFPPDMRILLLTVSVLFNMQAGAARGRQPCSGSKRWHSTLYIGWSFCLQ